MANRNLQNTKYDEKLKSLTPNVVCSDCLFSFISLRGNIAKVMQI